MPSDNQPPILSDTTAQPAHRTTPRRPSPAAPRAPACQRKAVPRRLPLRRERDEGRVEDREEEEGEGEEEETYNSFIH